jgi:hypothetical protein
VSLLSHCLDSSASSLTTASVLKLDGMGECSDNGNGRSASIKLDRQFFFFLLGIQRTSHSHGPNAVKGLFAGRHLIVVVLVGESQLVQHQQLAPRILDGLEGRHGARKDGTWQ